MGRGFGVGPQKFQNRPRAKIFWPKVAKRFIVTYIIDNSERDFRDETTLHPPLNCSNSRLGLFNLTLKWPTFAQARLRLLNFTPSTDIYDLPPEVYLWFVIFFQI